MRPFTCIAVYMCVTYTGLTPSLMYNITNKEMLYNLSLCSWITT